MFQDDRKKSIMEFMYRFEYNDRAVYFAENIQTLTQNEMQKHIRQLGRSLQLAGAHGVIEFHPSADGTSKSAHIHYWGAIDEEIESIIVGYIKDNRLSNKTYLNYTNEEMGIDREHIIINGRLVEYAFDRESEEEIKRETIRDIPLDEESIAARNAAGQESTYDDIIAFCDDVLSQLSSLDEPTEKYRDIEHSHESSEEIDMNVIYDYITELEIELYE